MNKIKILIIGMSDNLGGIETYLYNLYKYADKKKFAFDFTNITEKDIVYKQELEKDGCNIYKITPRYKSHKKHVEDLKNIFSNNNYDYIHFNIMSYSWYEPIVVAKKYSNAQIIVHSHCGNIGFLKKARIRTKILDKIGKFKTRDIPYKRVACGELAGQFMFGNKDFEIFYNGVNIEKFKYNYNNRIKIRKELNITEESNVYGAIAKFDKTKNHDFIIDIFSEIVKKEKESKLVLVGEGKLENRIKSKVNELNLEKNVIFLGKRQDVNEIYSALDAIIMPSYIEGISISQIEAQVNGLMCYASNLVDKNADISGNVTFISLEKSAREWAEIILNNNNTHDLNILNKIPKEYEAQNCYKKVYEFYEKNNKTQCKRR